MKRQYDFSKAKRGAVLPVDTQRVHSLLTQACALKVDEACHELSDAKPSVSEASRQLQGTKP